MPGSSTPDLSTTIAGIRMRSPLGVGSIGSALVKPELLTPERHAETLTKHVEAGAGFICLPLTTHVPDDVLKSLEKKAKPFGLSKGKLPGARFMRTELPGAGSQGLYVRVGPSTAPAKRAQRFASNTSKVIDILKQKKIEDVPIIANILGLGAYPETFVSTAKAVEAAGVDMIEIDFSCCVPLSMDESVQSYFDRDFPLYYAGFLMGDQPDLAAELARQVVKAVRIPVGVKASPETGFPRIVDLARRARDAGCRFINCGNMAVTIAPPDIYNKGKTKWPNVNGNPFVALGGGWLRPIVRKQVAAIARFAPGIDIVATGGIVTHEHMLESMMLGAKACQVATGMMYHGRGLITRNLRGLSGYMKEQGYNSLDEVIGLAQKHIKPENEMASEFERLYAEVDEAKCSGCGTCTQQICLASYMDDGVARIRIGQCEGCGMCVALCPQGAISLKTA